MPIFTTVIQYSSGNPSHSNQTNKRNKRHPNRKRSDKAVTLCWWQDTINTKPQGRTPKLPELLSKFSKVAGYKINIQKSVAFLYTNNEILEKEYNNTIPFKIATQKIKYLCIHLTQEVKDLYAKKYKTLIKEIKDVKKWKDSPCSWMEKKLIL